MNLTETREVQGVTGKTTLSQVRMRKGLSVKGMAGAAGVQPKGLFNIEAGCVYRLP